MSDKVCKIKNLRWFSYGEFGVTAIGARWQSYRIEPSGGSWVLVSGNNGRVEFRRHFETVGEAKAYAQSEEEGFLLRFLEVVR